MIKILHVSDIHIGMTNYGRTDKTTGINTRILDFLKSLDVVVDTAIKEKVDLFLFTGDAFKTRDPSPTEQREFAKRIKKVAKAGIPVFLLVGNHDLPNALGKANSLEIYKTLEVENVYVSSSPELLTIDLPGNKKIQIGTLPWMTEARMVPDKEDKKDKSTENVHRQIRKYLTDQVKLLEKKVDEKIPVIFAAHTTIAGAEFGGSRKVFIWSTVNLPLNVFTEGPWQYTALGHLHKHQVLDEKHPVVYAGSVDRVDFGEEKEDKGFLIVEVEQGMPAKYEFHKTPAREFRALRLKFNSGEKDPTIRVLDALKKMDLKDLVLKIIITMPEELNELLDEREIRKAPQASYFFSGIEKDYVNKSRKGQFDYLESLAPLELLDKYLSEKKAGPARKEKILKAAQEIIKKHQ